MVTLGPSGLAGPVGAGGGFAAAFWGVGAPAGLGAEAGADFAAAPALHFPCLKAIEGTLLASRTSVGRMVLDSVIKNEKMMMMMKING